MQLVYVMYKADISPAVGKTGVPHVGVGAVTHRCTGGVMGQRGGGAVAGLVESSGRGGQL